MEETIIIDEHFEGVYKCGWYFKIDVDITFPNSKIEIKIPLVSSKSIFGESLEVGEWLEVGKSLEVGEWLKVGEWLEVGEWLSIFGEKSSKYMLFKNTTYQILFTSTFIKIGCQLHKVEKWESFTDKQISAMDGEKALNWWKQWREFVLTTHKNLPEVYNVQDNSI